MTSSLRGEEIVATTRLLGLRIKERFPESGLSEVAQNVVKAAEIMESKSQWIARPNLPLRVVSAILLLALLALLGLAISRVRAPESEFAFGDFVSVLEAGLSSVVFLGAAAFFLLSLEARLKRNRALRTLHELRALAHVIDMHQLTKDPDSLLGDGPSTASSPKRSMTPFELGRYLDYCSEMLALLGKMAALYGQELVDTAALAAVDQVETLTTGLSRKIWQKLMMIDRHGPTAASD